MSRKAIRGICLAALAAAIVLLPPLARAGTTGKVAGRVTNEKKEPLAGVNIRIEGTHLGAASDESGNYYIIGVPAGAYTLRADLLGQAPFVAERVQIAPDFTTILDIVMRTQAIQLGEVRVEAERPLLQRDATGTTRFITSQDIQALPTRGYRDAAAQQTGVVNYKAPIFNTLETQNAPTLIVRGGRPEETAYFVDGFSQQDPLTGTSNTEISNNAIQEVVVLTGGFNAEYGRIMSGAVNVITREGTSKYSGSVESVTDALAGKWIGAPKADYNIYDASLGGPVIPGRDNLTFYGSMERRWEGDRSPSFLPGPWKDNLSSLPGVNTNFKPSDSSDGWTFQGKLSYQPTENATLKVGGIGSRDLWNEYRNAYLFDLDHAPKYLDRSESYFAKFNQLLSKKTFFDVAYNFNLTERRRGDGTSFDNLSPQYVNLGSSDSVNGVGFADGRSHRIISGDNGVIATPGGYFRVANPTYDLNVPLFWDAGHVWDDYLQRRSQYHGVTASLTSQITPHHQFKAGGDFQYHTLRFFEHYFPSQLGGENANTIDWDGYGYNLNTTYDSVFVYDPTAGTVRKTQVLTSAGLSNANGGRDGAKHPKVFSLYVQDKYEREGVVVNGGLRYDYLNVDTPALLNPVTPLDPATSLLTDSLLTKNKNYARFSPRLGVAFPVSARTLLRFNYGQFYQQPDLQDLYVSYRFLQYKVQKGGYFVGFGNPNLRPERTTAYEVGVGHELTDNVRLDVTAYYKDVKDLVEITAIPSNPNSFSSYRNRDFATIKGIDVGFKMRPINHVSGELNYSLSYAVGTGSIAQTQSNVAWYVAQQPKQTAPLDYDQRHKIAINLDYNLSKGEGLEWKGWRPFQNTDVNVLFNVASGTPYTPTEVFNEVTLAAIASVPSGPVNSQYGPWNTNLDLKASKGFAVGGLDLNAYIWVLNVFNTQNPIVVYRGTGSANSTGWLQTADGQAYLDRAASEGKDGALLYSLAQDNPNLYTNPRLVRFGLRANF